MSNKESVVFNDSTGEFIEAPKFRTMWCKRFGSIKEDCSNKFADVYEELAPYAIDPATGQLLNNSSTPKLVSKGKVNVWEKIQSYRKAADLYSILEKFAYSNDSTLLNARPCAYGDISNIPDNINDFTNYVDAQIKILKGLDIELANKVIDESYTSEDIEAAAARIYGDRVKASTENNVKEGNE